MQRFLTYLFICLRRTRSELPNTALPAEGPAAARWSQQRSRWCPAAVPAAVPAVLLVSRTVSSLPVRPPRPGVRLAGSGRSRSVGTGLARRPAGGLWTARPAGWDCGADEPTDEPSVGSHIGGPVQYGLFAWPARERRGRRLAAAPRGSPISRRTSCLWEQRPTAFCTHHFFRSNLAADTG